MADGRELATTEALNAASVLAALAALAVTWALLAVLRGARLLDLRARVVVVTGCDTGIGFHTCLQLLALRRAPTVVALCRTAEGMRALRRSAGNTTPLHIVVGDVTRSADIEALREAAARQGPVHALVNNAGVARGCFVDWTPLEDFREAVEVNYLGTVAATKAFLPLLKASRGRVVNVTSATAVEGVGSLPSQGAYVASKHAVEAFSRCLRAEVSGWGVRVVTVNPGFVQTDLVRGTPQRVDAAWKALPEETRARWGPELFRRYRAMVGLGARLGTSPAGVASVLVQATAARSPHRRYWVGLDAHCVFRPLSMAPAWVADALLAVPMRLMTPWAQWTP